MNFDGDSGDLVEIWIFLGIFVIFLGQVERKRRLPERRKRKEEEVLLERTGRKGLFS